MTNVIEIETPCEIHSNSESINTYEMSYTNTDMQYNDFFRRYLCGNRPCIVRGRVIESWKSANEWISNNRPNFSYICRKFGMSSENPYDCDVAFTFVFHPRWQRRTRTLTSYF
jgi:hypothetical protein